MLLLRGGESCPVCAHAGHIDIPLPELLVYEGDELIFDGADLATYVVLEHGTDIAAACGSDREHGGASDGDTTATGAPPARR